MGYYKKYKEEYYTWKKTYYKKYYDNDKKHYDCDKYYDHDKQHYDYDKKYDDHDKKYYDDHDYHYEKSIMMTMIIIMILSNHIKNITKSLKRLFIPRRHTGVFFMIFIDDTQIFLKSLMSHFILYFELVSRLL